ncbi:MAG: SpoIIE family protein phosphatase [Clostridia bacterium]|nr:SpoIIE family protein phosphatase [Clostridia bacterium]
MNDLCAEIGYKSINHFGEELCGDHIEIKENADGSLVIVLADGLGSGVKASILSTLTSKIISTMLSEGLSIEECVSTVAETLPVCSERGVAYSTFTIIHIRDYETADIIQYDNPHVILIRDGLNYSYPTTEMNIDGKKIFSSTIYLKEGDVFVAMSDGCPHAGSGNKYNFSWKREDIIGYMEALVAGEYTAKNLSTMLIDECDKLYENQPADDTTACVLKIRKREPMNLLFGPPLNRDDTERMLSLFFSKAGKHIVCGGTTSSIVAKYLRKKITVSNDFEPGGVPPISFIDGVDLVTEGVLTMNKVVEYAQDYISENKLFEHWNFKKDGASLICRLLFEEATDINIFVGTAINPAHQNPNHPVSFNIKLKIVDDLVSCLTKMGKRVKVNYY